jgi:hypothetical protein
VQSYRRVPKPRSEGERVHHPGGDNRQNDERSQQEEEMLDAFLGTILRNESKNEGGKDAENNQEEHVIIHDFRPMAMSNASTTTSMLSRPAT